MDPMKVVVDARTANPHFPGIGRYASNLIRALASYQDFISVQTLRGPDSLNYPIGPGQPETSVRASVFSLRQQWEIPRVINQQNATLYHSTYYLMPYHVSLPVVFTCHDLIPIVCPQYFSYTQRVIFRVAHLIASRISSRIIAVSESTKSDLSHYLSVDERKIHAIPLAPDEIFKPQSASAIEAIRGAYDLPPFYCLYVGANKPHKNLLGLLKAWQILHNSKSLEGHSLIIVGPWDSRYPEARKFTADTSLESVKFVGEVEEKHLPAIYSGATTFIQPSLYEGFGLPVIEAMACGAAVVCSNTASLPEVAGDGASFFNPRDPEHIATVLGNMIGDASKLSIMREKSIQQASRFSWKQTALETIEAYRRACVSFNR